MKVRAESWASPLAGAAGSSPARLLGAYQVLYGAPAEDVTFPTDPFAVL